MKSLLRATAIMSSLALLFGCVWFTQKQANRAMMPSSKSIDHLLAPPQPQTSSQAIMSGSKSFTGGTMVNSGVLQVGKTTQTPFKP